MAFTRRAQRRLFLLFVLTIVVMVIGVTGWIGRQVIRNHSASVARTEGLALYAKGEYELALPKLSNAVAANKDDVELLIPLAKSRSQVSLGRGKHILTAVGLYRRALMLEPDNLDALNGLLQLQIQSGMIAQLVDTARSIRKLDPENPDPIRILKEVAEFRGRLGPTRSTVGTDEDDSAIRWVDELISLEPNAIEHRLDRLALMEQVGKRKTEIREIAETWAESPDATDGRFHIVLAEVYLSQGMNSEGTEELLEGVEKGVGDPRALLNAITLLNNVGDTDRANELLTLAHGRAISEPDLAQVMVLMPWRDGLYARTLERVNQYQETLSDEPRFLVFLAQVLGALGEFDRAIEVIQIAEETDWGPDIDSAMREQIRAWSRILNDLGELEGGETPQDEYITKIQASEGVLSRIATREFASVILGDMYQRIGLTSIALSHYRSAVDSSGALHVVPAQRLIENLLQNRRALEALPISELLVRRHPQSMIAIYEWIRVRAALERLGLSASEEGAGLKPYETSYDLARTIADATNTSPMLKSLLIETAFASNNNEEAKRLLIGAIENKELLEGNLVFLAQLVSSSDSIVDADLLLDAILNQLGDLNASQSAVDAVLVLKTQDLRSRGMHDEAQAITEAHFEGRDDPKSRQILLLERLDHEMAIDPNAMPGWVVNLIDLDIGYETLSRLMASAVQVRDLELALIIKQRVDELLGEDSQPALLMEADLVLGFPDAMKLQEVPNRGLNKLIGALELQLDREPNSPDLVLRQFQLLNLLTPEDPSAATELLLQIVNARSDLIQFYPPLIAHLQQMGQFKDADRYIDRFERRKLHVSPVLRRAVDQLRLGQGNPEDALKAFQRSAEGPDATVEDKLSYLDLLIMFEETDKALNILNTLMEDEDRPISVDRRYALFQARQGDNDGAIATLRSAPGYSSKENQVIAIASMHLMLGRPLDTINEFAASPEILNTSAQSHLLMGRAQLAIGDIDATVASFDQALKIGRNSESLQISAASAMIESPQLREKGIALLNDILRSTNDRGLIEAMLLGAEAVDVDGDFSATEEQLVQAKALTTQYPGTKLGWTLAIQLYLDDINRIEQELQSKTKSNGQIDIEGIVELRDRHSEKLILLEEILKNATNRFEAEAGYPRRLAMLNLRLRDFEEALRFSKSAAERAPGDHLVDAVIGSKALIALGRYSNAASVIRPHIQEIIESNRTWQVDAFPSEDYRIAVEAMIHAGDINKATELLLGSGATPPQLVHWEQNSRELSYEKAKPVLEVLESKLEKSPASDLRILRAWIVVAQNTGDENALQTAMQIYENISSDSKSNQGAYRDNQFLVAQIELALAALQEISSKVDARNTYGTVLDLVPVEVRSSLRRLGEMNPEESQRILPWAEVLLIALNNKAAASATIGDQLEDALAATNEALVIAPNQTEILDTRAMVYIAMGQPAEAIRDALAASQLMPGRLDFKLTLVEAYEVQGNIPMAIEVLSEVERAIIMQLLPDESVQARAAKIRENLTLRQAG